MLESLDEELDMKIDDERLATIPDDLSHQPAPGADDGETYFSELFRFRQRKLSDADLELRHCLAQYTKAEETMLERTHIPESGWWVVEAVDAKRERPNGIHHLLSGIQFRTPCAVP
jgi:hypothetical protein